MADCLKKRKLREMQTDQDVVSLSTDCDEVHQQAKNTNLNPVQKHLRNVLEGQNIGDTGGCGVDTDFSCHFIFEALAER